MMLKMEKLPQHELLPDVHLLRRCTPLGIGWRTAAAAAVAIATAGAGRPPPTAHEAGTRRGARYRRPVDARTSPVTSRERRRFASRALIAAATAAP